MDKFSSRIIVAFLAYGSCIFSCVMYLSLEVKSSVEFLECLYAGSAAFCCAAALIVIIWKWEKLFEVLNDFEGIVQESQWKLVDKFRISLIIKRF